jgi:outer membrane protein assembly factor BamD (BamD/ComL family)
MKLASTLFLVAGLAALSACGGGAETNVATNNSADELYNLTDEDLGGENLLDANAVLGNEADANLAAPATDANAAAETTSNGL